MSQHHETNPHFVRPSLSQGSDQDQDHLLGPTSPRGPQPRKEGRSHLTGQGQPGKKRPEKQTRPPRADPQPARAPLAPHRGHQEDRYYPPYPRHHDNQQNLQQPSSPPLQQRHHADHPQPDHQKPHGSPTPSTHQQDQTRRPHGSVAPPLSQHLGDQHPRREPRYNHGLRMPEPDKKKALTWFTLVFCTIFWIVIILGGLIVLIVYLVFRPRIPKFDVSTATLNAAYLDMGYLLNADLTLLANFTNPNKKVSVDYSYMYVELYYGRTLIATQAIEPFSAPRTAARFANLHMVTSQVRLSELEIQRLKRQTLNNGVIFEVKGFFRARSNLGGFLRYSYWLHGQCTIMVRRPPDGVLSAKKCKTKHG